MNNDLLITFLILAFSIVLFLSERFTVDLVALIALIALGLSGVLTLEEVFSGFSDPSVITIIAIFILALSIEKTGLAQRMGESISGIANKSEALLIMALMGMSAGMSLVMNNIAVVSILLPATSAISKKSKIQLSRLLMPLAFGTLLGGTATLFTTTNIVMNSILRESGYQDFGFFDFGLVGIPLAVVGILYMAFWGRRLLPTDTSFERQEMMRQAETDLLNMYQLNERLFRAKIPRGSALNNKKLSESFLRDHYGLNVIAVERETRVFLSPGSDFVFQTGDIMLLQGRLEEFKQRDIEPYLEILPMREYKEHELESASIVILEVVLSPRSQLIGHTLVDSQFHEKYGMTVLSIWNGKRVIRTGLGEIPLEFGDSLLLQGPREKLPLLRADKELIVLSKEEQLPKQDLSRKDWLTIAIFVLTIIISTLGYLPVSITMLTGAVLMVLLRVVTMEQAYRAIDWRIVFLVAGMLPLGRAMTKTGATNLIANTLNTIAIPYGSMGLLLGLILLSVILAQAMKGAAVSAIIVPISIEAATLAGADPRAMAMGVALATSLAFITPLGHPVNIMMMGPGGYRFKDFFKVGLPLTILSILVIILLLPIFWPLSG
ncbi:MAG TPA: SLC13 family permease [Anaerolineales bacterium]|nr:SLC13 family permease [Anaerolineales bacterium]